MCRQIGLYWVLHPGYDNHGQGRALHLEKLDVEWEEKAARFLPHEKGGVEELDPPSN